MRTRFWSVETAERLRHAADAGRMWSVWPLGTLGTLLSVVFTLMVVYNGPALASRRASLEACAGMTSLLWLASSFVLAAALKQRLRELPDLPLAVLMAPVEPDFLGRYAQEFRLRVSLVPPLWGCACSWYCSRRCCLGCGQDSPAWPVWCP
jgi:hypothetical protein